MLNLCGFNGNDCMKELMSMMRWKQSKWRMSLAVAVLAIVVIGSIWLNVAPFRSGFEITDELGGIYSLPVFCLLQQRMLRSLFRRLDVCRKPQVFASQ